MIKNQYRFFVSKDKFQDKHVLIDNSETIHQLKKVLRLQRGQQIVLLDGLGWEYLVELEEINNQKKDNKIKGRIIEKNKNLKEPNKKIILCQALLKSDRFEQVLKFCTNLGVVRFLPFFSSRSIIFQLSQNKIDRYHKIIQESAEQSERGVLPKLEETMNFKEMIDFLKNKNGLKLMAWEEEKKKNLINFENLIKENKEIYLIIGPEGGFSSEEILKAKEAGFYIFSLGQLILRSEIAGLISSALILNS